MLGPYLDDNSNNYFLKNYKAIGKMGKMCTE